MTDDQILDVIHYTQARLQAANPALPKAILAALRDAGYDPSLNTRGDSMLADSKRWFPSLHYPPDGGEHHSAVHFALGLAGEVGEVVNLVKKVNRGDKSWLDVRHDLGYELADCLVYLLDLARTLNIDLDTALAEKRAICEERWG